MKKAIWCNLLSIQNEAISLVAMSSKGLWLVQGNHATVKLDSKVTSHGMKTYSESRIELQNLQILMKMLKSQVSFRHQESPVSQNAWMLSWILCAGVEKILSENLQLRSTLEAIRCGFWMKGALVMLKICVLCGWGFSNQFDIVSETPHRWDTVGCELWWPLLFSLLCPETDWNICVEKQS